MFQDKFFCEETLSNSDFQSQAVTYVFNNTDNRNVWFVSLQADIQETYQEMWTWTFYDHTFNHLRNVLCKLLNSVK